MARPTWAVDPVRWSDIQTEFGGTNPIGLSEYYGNGDFAASGQIAAKSFYDPTTLPPPPVAYRGVTAELQYVVQATSSNFSTSAPLHPSGSTPVYTGDWQTVSTLTSTSYTNSLGQTRYKWNLPSGTNLRPTVNTSKGSSISANGGFTHYIVMTPTHNGSGWSRPWEYFNLNSGSNLSSPSSTYQYHGPLFFLNNQNNYFQVRRPSNNTSSGSAGYGAYAYTSSHSNSSSSPLVLVVVWKSDSTAYYWRRQTGQTDVNNTYFSFSSGPSYGIDTTLDVATPVYADSIYWSTPSFDGFIEAGFFNAPLSDADAQTLANSLEADYC